MSVAHSVHVLVVGAATGRLPAPRFERVHRLDDDEEDRRRDEDERDQRVEEVAVGDDRVQPEVTIDSVEKSGTPIKPSSGVRMSATNDVITAPKAAPMTTATRQIDDVAAQQEVAEFLQIFNLSLVSSCRSSGGGGHSRASRPSAR